MGSAMLFHLNSCIVRIAVYAVFSSRSAVLFVTMSFRIICYAYKRSFQLWRRPNSHDLPLSCEHGANSCDAHSSQNQNNHFAVYLNACSRVYSERASMGWWLQTGDNPISNAKRYMRLCVWWMKPIDSIHCAHKTSSKFNQLKPLKCVWHLLNWLARAGHLTHFHRRTRSRKESLLECSDKK